MNKSKFPVIFSYILLLLTIVIAVPKSQAEPVQVGHVSADIVSEVKSIVPGESFWVALRLNLDEHWHVYWRNPGDAGLPPTIKWNLPDGFSAGEIKWPAPEVIVTGPLVSYGYHGDVLLPVLITPGHDLPAGEKINLAAAVDWLVCEDVCVPGSAKLNLSLIVADGKISVDENWKKRLTDVLAQLPSDTENWNNFYTIDSDNNVHLSFIPPQSFAFDGTLDGAIFLPNEKGIFTNTDKQELQSGNGKKTLLLERAKYKLDVPEKLEGVLLVAGESFLISATATTEDLAAVQASAAAAVNSEGSFSLAWALLFAFAGGLILNLMPCVLPVLSLKILGFVNQAGEDRKKIFSHGLLFTGGVLISFWILAGTLIVLQQGGEELGWGFQMQSPIFLMILSGFMFLFGLQLLGVFEIGTSLTTVGGSVSKHGGGFGSFLNGITATVVATPCTAPFMGTALGFSLSQPAWVSMLIFTSLGLGMAAPYLLLSGFPQLLRFVPKPGQWMETLKHIMGFFLLATVIWLGWVLSIQTGSNGLVILMFTLLLLGIGGWIVGRWGTLVASLRTRRTAYAVASLFVIGGMSLGLATVGSTTTSQSGSIKADGLILWEEFSPDRVEQLRAEGKPIFIDFTAAWCLSCQVNERVAFGSEDVQNSFVELNITPLKADWTSRDEVITRALAKFGRNSVPLYVLYGSDGETIILPEILTPDIVINALKSINKINTTEIISST